MLPDKDFEDLIRRKMVAHDEAPPTDGWKKIAADIRPPKKRRPIWWWLGPLLLLLTGVGVYYFPTSTPATKPVNKSAEIIAGNENQTTAPASTLSPEAKKINSRNQNKEDQPNLNNIPAPGLKSELLTEADNSSAPLEKKLAGKKIKDLPVKESAGQFGGVTNNKFTEVAKSGKALPVISQDNITPQTEQQQSEQNTDTTKPTITTDSIGKLAELTQLDSVQVGAKKDSITSENKELAKEQAAKEDKKKNKPKTWEAGFTFATRYAFRKFTPNATDNIFITNVNTRNQNQPERLGYEVGFNLARALTENFYLETGIAWLQLKENLTYTYTTGTIDTILVTAAPGQTNINPVYKMEERQLASSYAYGGWRLGASYYFWNNGRRSFNVSMAGGINLLLKGETEEYQNGQYLRKIVFPSRANILEQANCNLLVGVGYNTRLGQKLELMLMPSLNYFMGSTFKEREPLGLRPYSLGLNISLKRRFSRQN